MDQMARSSSVWSIFWEVGRIVVWRHISCNTGSYKICIDQGFPRSGDAYGDLVSPMTKRAAKRFHHNICNCYLCFSNIHTLLHQASKWGMRGLQGTIPRCNAHLPSDSKQQCLVLEAIVLIHNFCMEYVQCSQITTMFEINILGSRTLWAMIESLNITSNLEITKGYKNENNSS